MSKLFTPFALRNLELANRIVISPMCQYSAVDGSPSDWHWAHLGSLALSGAGLLCIEATAVTPEGRITPGDLGLYSDANEQGLAAVLRMIRAVAPIRVAVQLAHAGRKGSSREPWNGGRLLPESEGGWRAEAPSAVPHAPDEAPPRALDRADLARLRAAFASAAARAARLGVDALELHAAHGYLLHEFLSPVSNRRSDEYGGSLENRMRFPLEVFDAVRGAFPAERPVGVRISATDWLEEIEPAPPSWTLEQSLALARALKARGCDWIDVSSGGVSPQQKIKPGPGYQVPFAEIVRNEVGLATMAVGLITEPRQAEAIVAEGRADLVALARGMLFDPRWPWRAAAELGGTVVGPRQYWRALPREAGAIFGPLTFGQR
ncbi:MAG TPA: NADH:flavin oxidoreductase/NADH oxidase [Burkholderiaceae bacterium]|nr:NADH:flavin oxidoreductase/NADH oxidase [Burkholderiaceae bacterium]HQR78047.1 NADH:flavin oxidoreductase/NADH oxidase [Burkholderiaceae bacterium]